MVNYLLKTWIKKHTWDSKTYFFLLFLTNGTLGIINIMFVAKGEEKEEMA